MRSVAAIAGALLCAGCDVVWGLEGGEVPRSCGNPGSEVKLDVLADATLDGTTARGTEGTLQLNATSRVLVRLERKQALDHLSLRISLADYGVGCSPDPTVTLSGCVPCLSSSLGAAEVYLVSNDWDEATVTAEERKPGEPWSDGDRVLLGTFPFGPTGLLRMEEVDFTSIDTRLFGSEIALELVAVQGTNARFAAREGTEECVDSLAPEANGGCGAVGVCGDATRDPSEGCDAARECTQTCEVATCGDGVTDEGEDCDDGNFANETTTLPPSDPSYDACNRNCTNMNTTMPCGNGLVDPGEQCDDADPNLPTGIACKKCLIGVCGNGVIETDVEECDDSDLSDGDGCDSNCTITGCGNDIVTSGEECDDGNTINGDGCNDCVIDRCGDGVTNAPPEQCDDGPFGSADCTPDCVCRPNRPCKV